MFIYSCIVVKIRNGDEEMLDVIVIGAGQAGLSMGYFLQQGGYNFVILNGEKRLGDTWRNRYDSFYT